MDALVSFAPGLAVRLFLYSIGNISPKAEWALIGLWDGYAVQKMTGRTASHETTAIYALLFLVDLYISRSFYKTAVISLWTVLGVIVTELLGPNHRHDTTSERRRGRRRSINPVIPSQPIRAPPARQPRSTDVAHPPESTPSRRMIEEQTAVTFAAPSTTSLSSDMSSLASSGSATSRENIWDSVRAVASAQPHSSNETTHRATMYPSNSTTPYDTHLPSPPDTFQQRTPLFGEAGHRTGIAGNVPGGFTSRDETTSPTPTPRNSPPPLMVPYVNIDPPTSQGLLSSDSEPVLPPNLLSPLDIIPTGGAPQPEEYKIVPPRRSTPMRVVTEDPPVASTSRAVKAEDDDARLTSSDEDSDSDVPNDRAGMLKAAERYRQQAKGFDNDVKKLKTERKTAEDANKKRQSVALKSRIGTTEEQASKYHLKADSLFARLDNPPSKPATLDLKRVITVKAALHALKERLPLFLDSNEASLTIRLGTRVREHEVRQAIFAYLSEGTIPHRSNDPSVIVVTQMLE
ncbi:hypothetical protein CCMSSC00406_0002620 [Pleurotus cornucopiae]|uniref:Uncharacterized protein n=1 Tax=Pleurotus cornucopiae TaxID=5321 RepID=A0ACB7IS52_PLECO|nr:hypothetical protein CCMSSC00406_0002620 [Pleurotus cornucopiae]